MCISCIWQPNELGSDLNHSRRRYSVTAAGMRTSINKGPFFLIFPKGAVCLWAGTEHWVVDKGEHPIYYHGS